MQFSDFVDSLLLRTGCRDCILCFSANRNFRYRILPTYKHNRKDSEKPQLLEILKQYAIENFKTKIIEPLEADDVMGILATKYPGKFVIATIDKDLKQIPGHHYNWDKDEKDEVSLAQGDLFFYTQILTGDPVDGYPGCPGIGPVRAERVLFPASTNKERWEAIVKAYEAKGLGEKEALVTARVARILRASDYNFKTKKIKLWKPNRKDVISERN